MLWSWALANSLAHIYEAVLTSHEMDVALYDRHRLTIDDEGSGNEVSIGAAVSGVCLSAGIDIPDEESRLLAFLLRRARPVPVFNSPTGALLYTKSGKFAFRFGGGALEPLGDSVTLVSMDPSRYTAAWLIPGVGYLHPEGL